MEVRSRDLRYGLTLLLIFSYLFPCRALEQAADDELPAKLLSGIKNSKPDSNRISLQLKLGNSYFDKSGDLVKNLDTAINLFNQAYKLSIQLKLTQWQFEAMQYIGAYYFQKGEPGIGEGYFKRSIDYYDKIGDFNKEAQTLEWLGDLYYEGGRNEISKRLPLYERSRVLFKKLNKPKAIANSYRATGNAYLSAGDIKNGRKYYYIAIDYFHNSETSEEEAGVWEQLYLHLSPTMPGYNEEYLKCMNRMIQLYHNAKDELKEAQARTVRAAFFTDSGRLDLAEKELFLIIPVFHKYHTLDLGICYDRLSEIYHRRGNQYKELYYLQRSLNSLMLTKDTSRSTYYYYNIGELYFDLGNYEQSQLYASKVLDIDKRAAAYDFCYHDANLIVRNLLEKGQSSAALKYIIDFSQSLPPQNISQRQNLEYSLGECYFYKKDYAKAEYHYERLKNCYELSDPYHKNKNLMSRCYLAVGKAYAATGQYKLAKRYLGPLLQLSNNVLPLRRSKVEYYLSKADSASGDYLSALKHFQMHKKIDDSIFSAAKNYQISDLDIKYQTSKKEQKISLLDSRSKIQQAELQRINVQRNITVGGVLMLLVIVGLGYNSYRNKQHSNKWLQVQQLEINEQNEILQGLLSDKDNLLTEKDWLLKEVHHRVKNNLQIVMSLLSSQSAYLENSAAIEALRESQNRVQAISLIHQKLYKSNNVASIDMPVYVFDLLEYLADSFDTQKRRIRFEQIIEPFQLDLAQAVPIGLILNESVTNAIKYAFGKDGGQIIVALQLIRDETLLLTIADNGRGFPEGLNVKENNTLGMEMMKALSKQLGGEFKIESEAGVRISIEFYIEKVIPGLTEKIQ